MSEKGRCPVCSSFMRAFKTHYWRDQELSFPYEIYRCTKHGLYVWRDGGHELLDFSDPYLGAERKQLPEDASVQWFDPTIVEMKCPVCGAKWTQYNEFPSPAYGGLAFCPNGHAVKKELAV